MLKVKENTLIELKRSAFAFLNCLKLQSEMHFRGPIRLVIHESLLFRFNSLLASHVSTAGCLVMHGERID